MKRLSWRSILQRVEGRRVVGLWYGVQDGYLRIELDDGSVLGVAASWEGHHVYLDHRSRLCAVSDLRSVGSTNTSAVPVAS